MNWWNDESESKTYELLPDGEYVAIIEDAQLDATKKPNKLAVTYLVKDERYGGRKLWQNFTLSEKSAKFLAWQMGVLGVQTDAKTASTEEEYYKLVIDGVFTLAKSNTAVILEVTRREYQGKEYQNTIIKDLHYGDLPIKNEALGLGAPPEMDKDEELGF